LRYEQTAAAFRGSTVTDRHRRKDPAITAAGRGRCGSGPRAWLRRAARGEEGQIISGRALIRGNQVRAVHIATTLLRTLRFLRGK
jgi:hypothetical protein